MYTYGREEMRPKNLKYVVVFDVFKCEKTSTTTEMSEGKSHGKNISTYDFVTTVL